MYSMTLRKSLACSTDELFAYLNDIANYSEFCDHFLVDWRLTREDSFGVGAGARFKLKQRFTRFGWADLTLVEAHSQASLTLRGRGGMNNRVQFVLTWQLMQGEAGQTELTLLLQVRSEHVIDQVLLSVFGSRWAKRGAKRALKRMASILEEGKGAGPRITVAGGPRKPATRLPRPRPQA